MRRRWRSRNRIADFRQAATGIEKRGIEKRGIEINCIEIKSSSLLSIFSVRDDYRMNSREDGRSSAQDLRLS
jgi:hypothetical protein